MQKAYTADFLTKKQVPNRGELPQYYVEGDHEPIIPPEMFEMVQTELARRKEAGHRFSGVDIFASRIVCGECGSFYGAKVWHSTSEKYRRTIYRCNCRYSNGRKCGTPHLTEEEIETAFINALNKLVKNKAAIIDALEDTANEMFDTTADEAEERVCSERWAR